MQIINHLPPNLWEKVASESEYATFFHTPTWSKILVDTYPEFYIATQGFLLDDGIEAVVPMVGTMERNKFFKRYESIFPGGYGGVIARRYPSLEEQDFIFRNLADSGLVYVHIIGNPFFAQTLPHEYESSSEYTHILSLADGFETVYKNFSKGQKQHIRNAREMGIEIKLASNEDEYLEYYEGVYLDSLKRWGENTLISFPYLLFKQIYINKSDDIQLWIAKYNGEIISGSLNFYHQKHIIAWQAATCERYLKNSPSPLLKAEIIRDACQKGYLYYDFSPSGGLKGVEAYKESFNARKVSFNSYTWQNNRKYQVYQDIRDKAKRFIKRPFHMGEYKGFLR
jgi:hypothetical protein